MWSQVYLAAVLVGFALSEGDGTPRRTAQVPFVADALGNSLPPPAGLPAKVGSPSNLLTPDRYEFYTFDESGELVKRLMTLEEIQAIVAAGEGNDGHMVTFAQDEKPTIAFNFSQPPFTKVHSVVTNVQNVLKSQMEAQKKNPPHRTSFDTPDVTNSWSIILPSIFGNTGVEIVPDKISSSFGTPETETIDFGNKPIRGSDNNVSSKEDPDVEDGEFPKNNPPISDSREDTKDEPVTSTISTTTTEAASTTTTAKPKEITTTATTMSTTPKSTTITTTTTTTTTTTKKPTTTTVAPITTTTKRATTPATKIKITDSTKFIVDNSLEKLTTINSIKNVATKEPEISSEKPAVSHSNKNSHMPPSTTTETTYIEITKPKITPKPYTTPRSTTIFRLTTSIPNYLLTTKRTTDNEKLTKTVPPLISVTTYRPSSLIYTSTTAKVSVTLAEFDDTKNENGTTLTTQSVSPSTAHTTTDIISPADNSTQGEDLQIKDNAPDNFEQEPNPSFDVAQSISQIASDLGNSFVIQNNNEGLEAEIKENGGLDLSDTLSTTEKPDTDKSNSTFIKISTIDHDGLKETDSTIFAEKTISITTKKMDFTDNTEATTQVDPILSESMSDLLSQVADQLPNNIVQTTGLNEVLNANTESLLNRNDDMDIVTTTNSASEDHNRNNNNSVSDLKNSNTSSVPNNNVSTKEDIILKNNASQNYDFIKITTLSSNAPKVSLDEPLLNEENSNVSTVNVNETNHQENHSNGTEDYSEIIPEKNNSTILIKPLNDLSIPLINKRNGPEKEGNFHDDDSSETYNKTEIQNPEPINVERLQNHITNLANLTIQKGEPTYTLPENNSAHAPQKQLYKGNDSKKKVQKVNIEDKEHTDNIKNDSWKLVSTVSPPKVNEIPPIASDQSKIESPNFPPMPEFTNDPGKEINLDGPKENQGLEITIKNIGEDIYKFTDLCNELAFRYWSAAVENIDKKRSFILSPYSITSMLAMMFMGARGATSGEMNEILKLDDMVTFNPHFTLKNISDSIETTPESGVAVSAFVRELYSDRNRGKLLTFYKERAQHFYNGHVEEINFKLINDIIRRRTNLLVKRYTWGKINEYIKTNGISMKSPLAAFSANIFETDCTGSSVEGRDGEMYFVVSPSVRQRRLVPVPAVMYRSGFLAGYDPVIDATAASVGTADSIVSTVLLMPGQQGNTVHADDLERLERKLLDSIPTAPEWYRLLRTLLPRPGLELQIPRFSHRSVFNVSAALRSMGLHDIFDPVKADLGGLNGPSKDLYLSDMIQTSTFVMCGESAVGEQHHVEEYPEIDDVDRRRRNSRWASSWDEPRDYQRAFHDPHDVGAALLPLHLRPRQARLPARASPPQPARLKFDRPFLYFVRHNPSGMILYVGRYNPRLLP